MRLLAIKCSNKKCKEVFHRYDIQYPFLNDIGYIEIECKKCRTHTKIPVYNPVPYGFGGNYEIVDAAEMEHEDQEWGKLIDDTKNLIRIVHNFESKDSPIHKWCPHSTISLWNDGNNNYESISTDKLSKQISKINNIINDYHNGYLAGQHWAPHVNKIYVSQEYIYNGCTYKSIWAKECNNEKDYNANGLYLIYHSHCPNLIDGIYSRDTLLLFLERLLVRWKMTCNHILITSPFIGFDFKYSNEKDQKEIAYLWALLNGLQDTSKTTFLTRATTYTSLKKTQASTKELKEWGLMSNLQHKFHDTKTRDKTKEQFHCKIYAGIRNDTVELFSGSYNIQTGKILENMVLRTISLDAFKKNYLCSLIDDFKINKPLINKVLLLSINSENKIEYRIDDSNIIELLMPTI